MKWIELKSAEQIEKIKKESESTPVLIFKHSTRCATSRMSLDRLERNWNEKDTSIIPYFLDLINHRQVSSLIAQFFGVEHESPQVLLIFKGEAVLDQSHFEIDYHAIRKAVKT